MYMCVWIVCICESFVGVEVSVSVATCSESMSKISFHYWPQSDNMTDTYYTSSHRVHSTAQSDYKCLYMFIEEGHHHSGCVYIQECVRMLSNYFYRINLSWHMCCSMFCRAVYIILWSVVCNLWRYSAYQWLATHTIEILLDYHLQVFTNRNPSYVCLCVSHPYTSSSLCARILEDIFNIWYM